MSDYEIKRVVDPRIEKLPSWAQAEFASLMRERDEAVRKLHDWHDNQEETNIWQSDLVHTGESTGPESLQHYLTGRGVTFRTKRGGISLNFCEDENSLVVYGDRRILIIPRASNSFTVKCEAAYVE